MSIHFITFANTSYMRTDRIISQAKSFSIFDSITSFSENDIPEFIKKHTSFINKYKDGYGRFIWKSKIIRDKLEQIDENDILLYCDAGVHLNKDGIVRFHEYLEMLKTTECLAFLTSDKYKVNYFCKNDAIMNYYPELQKELHPYMYAGIVFLRKTSTTVKMITDWLELCETYNFLDPSRSTMYNEMPYFIGQDTDNGLFAMCIHKYKHIIQFINHTECNIYNSDGTQHYNCKDWSLLDSFPLQYRRDRPAR